MLGSLRQRFKQLIARARGHLIDPNALAETVERLSADGVISDVAASSLKAKLPSHIDGSRYILGHLGAHLGIAAVFAFDFIPLPLGTVSRVSWVAGNRVIEHVRGNPSRARMHSLPVFLIAAIPFLGYGAYLFPLRKESIELAFVLANHTWLARTGHTYEEFVTKSYPPIRRIARWLVPIPAPAGNDTA